MQGWERLVQGIVARLDGPLHFRFIGQPLMASIFAVMDGVKDAKLGNPPYFWTLIVSSGHRRALVKDGWKSVFKIFFFAMLLEAIYQLKVDHHLEFRGYALIAAFVLAILPYLMLRGPINRLVRLLCKTKIVASAKDRQKGVELLK
jgi:hypothetical protein